MPTPHSIWLVPLLAVSTMDPPLLAQFEDLSSERGKKKVVIPLLVIGADISELEIFANNYASTLKDKPQFPGIIVSEGQSARLEMEPDTSQPLRLVISLRRGSEKPFRKTLRLEQSADEFLWEPEDANTALQARFTKEGLEITAPAKLGTRKSRSLVKVKKKAQTQTEWRQ